jgi:hypothetical protein
LTWKCAKRWPSTGRSFEGAIVMVSHDRHLIGLVCDTYWRVADGVVEPFDGDLDAYAAWLRTRPQAQGTKARMEQVEEPVVVKTAPVAQVVQKKPVNPAQAGRRRSQGGRTGRCPGRTGPPAGRPGQLRRCHPHGGDRP